MQQNPISKKLKIAVTGSNGQLGQEFKHISTEYENIEFDFYTKQTLNISDPKMVHDIFYNKTYDYIINCAAYTAVDKAESDIENCYAINTKACQYITDAIKGSNTKLVHFSSDYVYHGYDGFPLKESDPTSPKGIYAASKLEGEQIIRASGVPTLILRTSWVISSYGHNFVKTMVRLGAEKETLNVVNDQYGAPTYARHLAKAVLEIIAQTESNHDLQYFNDTYNYANEGLITWYDLADRIMKEKKLNCRIHPIPSTEYPTPAMRPHWSVLSKHKIKSNFNLEIAHWYDAIKECLEKIDS